METVPLRLATSIILSWTLRSSAAHRAAAWPAVDDDSYRCLFAPWALTLFDIRCAELQILHDDPAGLCPATWSPAPDSRHRWRRGVREHLFRDSPGALRSHQEDPSSGAGSFRLGLRTHIWHHEHAVYS